MTRNEQCCTQHMILPHAPRVNWENADIFKPREIEFRQVATRTSVAWIQFRGVDDGADQIIRRVRQFQCPNGSVASFRRNPVPCRQAASATTMASVSADVR
jgi:hypothetical protein